MAQFLDSFLSLHGFSAQIEFFNVNKLFWLVHFRVSCALSVLMKPDARVQVFCVAGVEAVAFAQDHVNVVGHL